MIPMKEWVSQTPPLNVTSYKAVWAVWLWIGTAAAVLVGNMALALIAWWASAHGQTFTPPDMMARLFEAWLFGLAAFSGINVSEFYAKRKTDLSYAAVQAGQPIPEKKPPMETATGKLADTVERPAMNPNVAEQWANGDPEAGLI